MRVTELARWLGRNIGIVINAGPVTLRRTLEIVDYSKFGFDNNSQGRNPKPQNVGRETRVKNWRTLVYDILTHHIMNNDSMRNNAGVIAACNPRGQIPPVYDAHR